MANEMHLIDANKLMVCHINVGTVMFPKMEAFVRAEDIKAAPIVDAVEVVRCKDCKHCESGGLVGGGQYFECRCREFLDDYAESIAVLPDDFCSYGERRES